ncbi:TerB family tellurite resistance protein [Gloeobacter morelensis]|uniref:TerB family tellurite resistance protein n=1 Tax=Gloeobacter morelensis MG652769 TaxID=2781736 RepID=A0ABY3PI16_9CYAN|nr:TerB family tellurite resistance protein [Gloeobacter morelensis]UFP93287.1 TerB family tellurite resistance protein [Gloeobacter morelensis MG652769]
MKITQPEALACLKIMVRVAMADGYLKEDERLAIGLASRSMGLRDELSIETLMVKEDSLEELLVKVQSPEARTALLKAAASMSAVDGERSPEEQAMLDQIEAAFRAPNPGA